MYLCVSGFLPESTYDDSLKFELDLDSCFNEQVVQLLGHKNLNEMSAAEWLLDKEQLAKISELIGQALPTNLKMFIGVLAWGNADFLKADGRNVRQAGKTSGRV
ncbi:MULTISPECIES: pyocin S6 family toxin immunity protein [unclassified Pseudomonas]|uniref:pyocin S6 family toxin immunity protein n=1 Tax=unclassified Pseudomonas TaxID=196821 RepID=UPI002114DE3C|nr:MULTISPECIES: pyocin S6 family toxin immunity protein [unclassified Pseudomonas]MCU1740713.1 pyocin S6 family toxin immunity protein [Pseudomonas sp. 20S_6.2_Bac1]